jgi:drug/metabolite transporter (DMT)-like permease
MTKTCQALDAMAMGILLVLCASWGFQQVSIKIVSQGISPLIQSGIRSAGAAILLLVWMRVRHEPLLQKDGTLWWGMAVGILFAGEFLLLYWGLEFTLASRSAIFLYLSPFVVALGAQLFIPGERLNLVQVVGLCCAFIGIVFAFSESLSHPTYRVLLGDAMIAGAAVFWGSTTVLVKASPLARIKPSKTLLYQLAVSAVVLPIGAMIKREPGIVALNGIIIANILYQTFWVAFITYLAWFWLIRNYPPSRLASFTFCTPLFGVIAGGLLLNEPITGKLLLALVCVGLGIYLVNKPDLKSKSIQQLKT